MEETKFMHENGAKAPGQKVHPDSNYSKEKRPGSFPKDKKGKDQGHPYKEEKQIRMHLTVGGEKGPTLDITIREVPWRVTRSTLRKKDTADVSRILSEVRRKKEQGKKIKLKTPGR